MKEIDQVGRHVNSLLSPSDFLWGAYRFVQLPFLSRFHRLSFPFHTPGALSFQG